MIYYPYPMERVLYGLHHQVCSYALRHTTSKGRHWAERCLLVLAVCGFGALLLVHLAFVHRESRSGGGDAKSSLRNIPLTCLSSIPNLRIDADIWHLSLDEDGQNSRAFLIQEPQNNNNTTDDQVCSVTTAAATIGEGRACAYSGQTTIFSFSKYKGYLLLPPDVCQQKNLIIQQVIVSKSDVTCFGEPFLQKLIFRLIGPDTVMINWLLPYVRAADQGAGGFVLNVKTGQIIDLSHHNNNNHNHNHNHNHAEINIFKARHHRNRDPTTFESSMLGKLAVLFKSTFLFFITTTLVSFTLRETQERMLDFTRHLQLYVRANQSIVRLVTMHLVDSFVFVPISVGLICFQLEFYRGDRVLAFVVVSLVWLCEAFSVVSLRSSQGMFFFPRIFFLLFSLFHFYLFSFPFGFSYTALASTACFMAHSMIFFWHRYELPAVALGVVTIERPRMGSNASPSTTVPSASDSDNPSATSGPTVHHMAMPPPASTSSSVRLVRQYSAASSMGRISRPSSSGGLFHHDDESSSYLYFMDGEVVMHRRPPSPLTANGSVSGSVVGNQSTTSSEDHHYHVAPAAATTTRQNGIPDRILTEVGVLDHHDDEDDDDRMLLLGRTPHDPPETSTLQAILLQQQQQHPRTATVVVENETPRTANLAPPSSSSSLRDRHEDMLVESAPPFPSLE